MADLISRKALVTKLSKGYWDRELQQAKNDPCVIDAMIDWAIRIVNEMPLESPWHTGTPTKEGWYLVAYECVHECRNKGKLEYFTMHILEDEFGYKDIRGRASDDVWKAVAYQKIEPYKEEK